MGPPDYVVELGFFMHPCEGEMVCRCTNEKVPYFNAPVYLENKTPIGKVDEILGSITEVVRYSLVDVDSSMPLGSMPFAESPPPPSASP